MKAPEKNNSLRKRFLKICCLSFAVYFLPFTNLLSQAFDPLHPPDTYRNADNPQYWKNRKPYEGYWQQDVHYSIKADLDEKTDIISGKEQLTYWNNSPDDLTVAYFHLYQNAFQPGSYLDKLQKSNNYEAGYGKYESQKKGTEVLKIQVNGTDLKTELDNTILKVFLPQPLKSGASITFDIEFKTYFDASSEVRRRMKIFNSGSMDTKHYDGVLWYPRITVYDRKFGWCKDQHLGREFYGDYGAFDVELTLASNFVLDATGFLLNREEVLPAELRQKLDIKNFKDKPWGEKASIIIPYDSAQRKTWKFHAENVHDFAFTADPTYRIGEAECLPAGQAGNGIQCIALAQETHAGGWQNAAEYTARIIQTFSEDIGMYVYNKMIVADARDGMEYPMLTLDGGSDPEYRGLFVHEVGHNWFYGQVGNNETYRAALDEGFTQFLTVWGLEKLEGDTLPEDKTAEKGYKGMFRKPAMTRERSGYRWYISDAIKSKDSPLNTHSDMFGGALAHGGGYRHVYYKTATMLYNLQYVLGEELFIKAMQHYFNQWKICHPYFEDFRNSIINYTGADLNWFFDQWMETTKRIDYAVTCIKKDKETGKRTGDAIVNDSTSSQKDSISNKNNYIVTFKRKDGMQMPLDFQVIAKNGNKYTYHIPNDWFVKKTEATVLPRWIGWDKLQTTYEAKVNIPSGIREVIIDTSGRLADVNKLDNRSKCPSTIEFDSRVWNYPSQDHYEMYTRPDIWYNGFDGLKAGFHLHGSYMDYLHTFNANFWFNGGVGQQENLFSESSKDEFDRISFRVNYKTPLDKFIPGSSVFGTAKYLDGLQGFKVGFDKKSNSEESRVYAYFKSMYRANIAALNYLLFPAEWNHSKYNNTLNVGLDHHYDYPRGTGDLNLNMQSSALYSDYDYSDISLGVVNNNYLGRFNVRTRLFTQYGLGKNWAPESQLYFAGANPEELMDDKFTRSVGFFPSDWLGYGASVNHFHMGGGLNMRGYSGYLIPQEIVRDGKGDVQLVYKGTSGAAFNTEIEFNRLIPFNPRFLRNAFKVKTYLFGDAGVINYSTYYENLRFSDLRIDAGVGTTLTIQKWGPLEMINPLTIRFDMPFFLNRIPATEKDYLAFRWVLAVGRAF